MRTLSLLVILTFSLIGHGADKKLVDVDKDSKLSSYFQKINGKVTDNPEEKPLVTVKDAKTKESLSLDEEEILLKEATSSSQKSSTMTSLNKMVVAIFSLLILAALFWTGVQKMGKKQGHSSIAKNIKILTQKPIGPKKQLMLIRVAGETLLLGVTDHSINHLKTLSLMEDELPSYTEPQFSNSLKEKIEETKQEPSQLPQDPEEVDGFSISRIDDVKKAVSRYTV